MEKKLEIAFIEKEMRYLLHLPIINEDIVKQYKRLESAWIMLTKYSPNKGYGKPQI